MKKIQQIIKIGKKASKNKKTPGKSGNISIKSKNYIFITKTGSNLSDLTQNDIVYLTNNIDSFHMKRRGDGLSPSIETGLHIRTYEKTESNSIIHTHPIYTRILSEEKNNIPLKKEEQKILETKKVTVIKEHDAGSKELAIKASEKLKNNKAVAIRGHGLITRAKSLQDALDLTEMIEQNSEILYKKINKK